MLQVNKERLVEGFSKLGLGKGDVVLVHSSLKSLGHVLGGAQTVIDALLEVVTPEGTLIVPTYQVGIMYNTCSRSDYIFDVRSSGTKLGLIPAAFLKQPGLHRSIHPTHSVSAIGREAEFIVGSHHEAESTYGVGSPWHKILQVNGKVMGLGVTVWCVAYSHVLETEEGDDFPLPVWVDETYHVKCRDHSGQEIVVDVRPLDPEVSKDRIDKKHRQDLRDYFWRDFLESETISLGKVGQAECWIGHASQFLGRLRYLMKEGITIYTPKNTIARPAV